MAYNVNAYAKVSTLYRQLFIGSRWEQIPNKPQTFVPSPHGHGDLTDDGRIGTTANRVIVTTTAGKLTAKAAGTTSQFLRGDGAWAVPQMSVDTTQNYTWTGQHNFREPIRFTPNTATYYLGSPETGGGTVNLPYNKSGTIALTSDIPDVIYGYCGTSASTTAKVVSSSTFTSHKAGQIYVIEFVNGNTATAPTININSTGAIGVRHLTTNGAVTTSPGTDIMYARSRTIWTFVYNGEYLIPIGKSTRYWNALETKMLGYSKGSSSSAITTSDTVSSAIGKLEYRLDNSSGAGLELVRDRGHGANLDSVGAGTTSGYVVLDKLISPGDTLMIEVSKYSGGTYNPKIVTVTVGTSSSIASTTDADYLNSWSYFNGTNMGIYTFTCWAGGSSSSSLYFGAKRYIQGSFSGTSINWTTSTYTLYVGRVWRVNR